METRHKTQRETILTAATDLLASGGAAALRVRDIATAADCSTMGVYSHFGGKDGLIDAIFVDGFECFTTALQDAWTGPSDTRLERIGIAYRTWALANPGSYSLMFGGAIPGFVPSDASLAIAAQSFGVLTDGVVADQAAGRLRVGDPVDHAWGLWGMVHGLVMLELTGMTPPTTTTSPQDAYHRSLTALVQGLTTEAE